MSLEDLSPELQEKARACKSKEELAELAAAVGVHLSDAELEAVTGGTCTSDCPLDGATCRIDSICSSKSSCPAKGDCKDLFRCIPKYCVNLRDPVAPCAEDE